MSRTQLSPARRRADRAAAGRRGRRRPGDRRRRDRRRCRPGRGQPRAVGGAARGAGLRGRHLQPVEQADPRRPALPGAVRLPAGARGAVGARPGWCRPSRRTWSRRCRSCCRSPRRCGSAPTTAPASRSTTSSAPPSPASREIPRHRHLSRTATLAAFPGLRGDVVRGVDPLLGRPGRRRPAHAGRRPHRRRLRRPGALQRPGRPGCSATATGPDVAGRRRAGGRPDRRVVVHRPRPQRHRRDRRVERRHRRDARRLGAEPEGAGVQGRAPGGAALGDRRLRPGRRGRAAGRADPADADQRAVRHPVGRALDRRHHRHPVAAGPRPPGRLQRRHRLHARPGQPGARPAGDPRPDPGRLRRPAAAAGRGVRRDQPALPRARRRHARCPGWCWWPAASTRPTG